MNQKFVYLLILVFWGQLGYSQLREVKSRATAFKNTSSSSRSDYYSSNSGESLFLFDLFVGIFKPLVTGVSYAQKRQIEFASDDEWRRSIEFKVNGGIGLQRTDLFNSQAFRGNYGLFSTQVRRFNVNDVSGSFTTLDWQILQLNLINTENVRWVLGGGFSHEIEIDQSHFEWTTELYISIFNKKLVPGVQYRRSGDGYPRTEFSALTEYRPFRSKGAEFAFNLRYVYQKLYDIPFDFASVGISFYLK